MGEEYSPILEELERKHLNSFCTDPDCWCHDEQYWADKYDYGEDEV